MGPKREKFQMRISEEEDDAFRKEAYRVGLTTSEWLRQLGRKACGMPTLEENKR
jgi:hypothetical protein